MRHLRQNTLPKVPSNCQDIRELFEKEDIMKEYGLSYHDSPRIFYKGVYECASFAYCVFASDEIIETMQANITVQNRHFLIDATFKVVPLGPFTQLLVIYTEYFREVGLDTKIYKTLLFFSLELFIRICVYIMCLPSFNLFLGFSSGVCIYVQENTKSL